MVSIWPERLADQPAARSGAASEAILHFSRDRTRPGEAAELIISNDDGSYTEGFVELMKDYYL